MSRKYDPTGPTDISEIDKLTLDKIILAYWTWPKTVSFDEFFFYQYNLYEFTKKELIYMDINAHFRLNFLHITRTMWCSEK